MGQDVVCAFGHTTREVGEMREAGDAEPGEKEHCRTETLEMAELWGVSSPFRHLPEPRSYLSLIPTITEKALFFTLSPSWAMFDRPIVYLASALKRPLWTPTPSTQPKSVLFTSSS